MVPAASISSRKPVPNSCRRSRITWKCITEFIIKPELIAFKRDQTAVVGRKLADQFRLEGGRYGTIRSAVFLAIGNSRFARLRTGAMNWPTPVLFPLGTSLTNGSRRNIRAVRTRSACSTWKVTDPRTAEIARAIDAEVQNSLADS